MMGFVSNRRVNVLAAVASMAILGGFFVVPGGSPWAGYVWFGALAVLFVATATAFLGGASAPSMSEVIYGVEGEPKVGDAAPVTARNPGAR